jgi:hypothetical protein
VNSTPNPPSTSNLESPSVAPVRLDALVEVQRAQGRSPDRPAVFSDAGHVDAGRRDRGDPIAGDRVVDGYAVLGRLDPLTSDVTAQRWHAGLPIS